MTRMPTRTPIKVAEPPKKAGGIPAVLSSMKHAWRKMGLLRSIKVLLKMNQKAGFDCPGCAWPEPDDERSITEFCENGAKAIAEEATLKRVTAEFWAKHSIAELKTKDEFWLGKKGRITQPVYKAAGDTHYRAIDWHDAFAIIAEKLKSLASPDEAIFYTSGRTSNEAAYLYQLFVRMLGTNNLPDCSNMCHESSGVGLSETIGIGKGTVTLEDFSHADCIMVIGQNPGTNHPRMLAALQKAARNKAEIIHINPLPEAGLDHFIHPQEVTQQLGKGTKLATQFIPVKINGDVALLQGIAKYLLEWEAFDQKFIDDKTEGFSQFRENMQKVTWQDATENSGINQAYIKQVAQTVSKSKRLICCWAMGLTQHKNAVANIQEIVNILLLGGHFGRQGAGACPVRGHSNVQGDRTMGIWEVPDEKFISSLEQEFKCTLPRTHGYHTVTAIKAMAAKKAKVFFAMGGNFLSATPDTACTGQALENCELTVQVSTKPNLSHAYTGKEALILPCLARSEVDQQNSGVQYVTVENSMGYVHASQGNLPPASAELKSEVAIVCELAQAVLGGEKVNWPTLKTDYDLIRDLIEKTIPGFTNFNKRISIEKGFYLPNAIRDKCEFLTDTKKARFTVHDIPKHELADNQLMMMTIRTHDQYNTTIYGLNDRYRGLAGGRRVILLNKDDCAANNLQQGDFVDIHSHFQGKTRTSKQYFVVPYPIPKSCCATYFPEANELVPVDSFADRSFTPTSKSVVVSLSKQ